MAINENGLIAALENEVEHGTNKQFAQYLLDEFVDGKGN